MPGEPERIVTERRHASRTPGPPRPSMWRLALLQVTAWLSAVIVVALLLPEQLVAVVWAGLITVIGQAFWIWRSLRGFGDPSSGAFLAGTTVGLIGKWVIVLAGLVVLWRQQPGISVAATVVTVFALNTLAAMAAPILISRPR